MIRLVQKNKATFDVPMEKVPFLEIVNDLDQSVQMVILSPEPGRHLIVYPGSEDAQRYEALMHERGIRFTDKVIHRR